MRSIDDICLTNTRFDIGFTTSTQIMTKYHTALFLLIALLAGCQPDGNNRDQNQTVVYPGILKEAIRAVDPAGIWPEMRRLQFTLTTDGSIGEKHLIDMASRKALIRGDGYKIGFDGEQAWISPSQEAFAGGSPRFYYGQNFYFFSMPHVFTDPGIKYKAFPDRVLDGKKYKVLYIGFDPGTGDTPLDEYTAFFDPETHMLAFVLYTVTYFRDNASDQFYACRYDAWQEVDGILVPEKLTFLDYFNGETGRVQNVRTFTDVKISPRKPWDSRFSKPRAADVDSLVARWRE